MKVAKEMFCSFKMTLPVVGHESGKFANSICNVWSRASRQIHAFADDGAIGEEVSGFALVIGARTKIGRQAPFW